MEKILQFFSFIEVCAIYFTLQLVWCAICSYLLVGFVMLLRGTICSKKIFAKGMLWAIFLVTPFLGKIKVFYESGFVMPTWWLTGCIMKYTWIVYIYMTGVILSFLWIFGKRARLQKLVSRMEQQCIGQKSVYITELSVTPFTIGLLKSKIVLPKAIIYNYNKNEIDEIILHEQTHIRLGHLWCYFAWDVLRCLLWINPFLLLCQKYLRTDMEDICDRVCIQKSGKTAQEYGRLLLKTIKLLRSEQNNISSVTAFVGEKDFEDIKIRMKKIAEFRSYTTALCKSIVIIGAGLLFVMILELKSISYDRCNEMKEIFVYEYNSKDGGTIIIKNSNYLQQIISYDNDYVYVDKAAFERLLNEKNAGQEIFIVFGGFHKLPGIGNGGYSCFYQADTKGKIAKIPYEKPKDNWMTTLFKIL